MPLERVARVERLVTRRAQEALGVDMDGRHVAALYAARLERRAANVAQILAFTRVHREVLLQVGLRPHAFITMRTEELIRAEALVEVG